MSTQVDIVRDRREVSPQEFLSLLGHPLRWRLVSELARSDRQVRELSGLLGERQSLVSYHLGRLRADHLVTMRRSSADRRDVYYSIALARCGELMVVTSAALHPGLRLAPPSRTQRTRRGSRHARVLFLCTGNSTRSQMAEAFAEKLGSGTVEASSAGSHPKSVHPNAVKAMRERRVDLSRRHSKHVREFARRRFDYVITLCDRVREVCPEFPGAPMLIHWSIADPSLEGETDRESLPAFRRTATEIESRIRFLLHVVDEQP